MKRFKIDSPVVFQVERRQRDVSSVLDGHSRSDGRLLRLQLRVGQLRRRSGREYICREVIKKFDHPSIIKEKAI